MKKKYVGNVEYRSHLFDEVCGDPYWFEAEEDTPENLMASQTKLLQQKFRGSGYDNWESVRVTHVQEATPEP